MQNNSFLGFGLGLRPCHYDAILDTRPSDIDWFEIVSEDFLVEGGPPLHYLHQIREQYPVVMHGVSLSIGGTDPLDQDYLARLKKLADQIAPHWISDHICWTGVDGLNLHGLLPLPHTEETIRHIAKRTRQVQEFLGRQILLENISTYLHYTASDMTEWEFISAIAEEADCLILLDVNNAYVNAFNHGFSASDLIRGLPKDRVKQLHMAGHDHCKTHIIDTHDQPIPEDVWSLYETALRHFGPVSTLIERDDNIPDLSEMVKELNQAKRIHEEVLSQKT